MQSSWKKPCWQRTDSILFTCTKKASSKLRFRWDQDRPHGRRQVGSAHPVPRMLRRTSRPHHRPHRSPIRDLILLPNLTPHCLKYKKKSPPMALFFKKMRIFAPKWGIRALISLKLQHNLSSQIINNNVSHLPHIHTPHRGHFHGSRAFFACYRGGYASNLISVDYIKPYSLLRALCVSAGSRLFACINIIYNYNFTNN